MAFDVTRSLVFWKYLSSYANPIEHFNVGPNVRGLLVNINISPAVAS